jgi:hypothetical protein
MDRMHTTTSRLSTVALAALSLSMVACFGGEPVDTGSGSSVSSMAQPPSSDPFAQPVTVDRSDRDSVAAGVLDAFARGDWDMVAELSADTGVRFTPHTHVNVETDQTLTNDEIANFATDQTQRTWGTSEGSGEPIVMTNAQYLARYVWDHDYRTAHDVRWNATQDRGNVIDNVQDVYPGASVVEYHFSGFDEQYGGMDWRSLRLVLAQDDDGQWTLYGVIHDEWAP